jgi:hypothetical protein
VILGMLPRRQSRQPARRLFARAGGDEGAEGAARGNLVGSTHAGRI